VFRICCVSSGYRILNFGDGEAVMTTVIVPGYGVSTVCITPPARTVVPNI
jgi:hypothetical protein